MAKNDERKQIKLFLSAADHDRLRLAAALRRTGMADFCRQAVLAETIRLTQGLSLETAGESVHTTTPTSKRRKST